MCIDATDVIGSDLNQLNIRGNYFAAGFSVADYSIGLNASTANVILAGNVFLDDAKAGVSQANLLLRGTPQLFSSNYHVTQ
jgi:hypothetical protein